MTTVECRDCGATFDALAAFASPDTFTAPQGCPECSAGLDRLFEQRDEAEREAVAAVIDEAEEGAA